MNLQVDLMLDTERRSGSSISRKFVIRLAAVIFPVIFAGWFAALFVSYQASKHNRNAIEQEKQQIDPEYKKVVNLEKELKSDQSLMAAIQSWRDSRLDAYRLIRGLQRAAPLNIQLTQFVFSEKVEAVESAYGRTAGIYMKGKVGGERPEFEVQVLCQALTNLPPFPDIMAKVEVKHFDAAEALNEKDLRVFDLECKFKARNLVPTAVPAK